MADPKKDPKVKTIVVPAALEEFFAEKLRTRYAERSEVEVIVDRRDHERRHGGNGDAPALDHRRSIDRRLRAGWWSLPDLPFESEKAS